MINPKLSLSTIKLLHFASEYADFTTLVSTKQALKHACYCMEQMEEEMHYDIDKETKTEFNNRVLAIKLAQSETKVLMMSLK